MGGGCSEKLVKGLLQESKRSWWIGQWDDWNENFKKLRSDIDLVCIVGKHGGLSK